MKERPILFSGPMVRAILSGKKTQTRRVAEMLLDGETTADGVTTAGYEVDHRKGWGRANPGDRLWVKESIRRDGEPLGDERWCPSVFIADGSPTKADCWPWKNKALPSIHMPRGLCRIVLEVTGVRVDRLNDITEDDAKAEGVEPFKYDPEGDCWTARRDVHRSAFEYLWNELHGWEPNAYATNPWVWVVSFKRIEQKASAAE